MDHWNYTNDLEGILLQARNREAAEKLQLAQMVLFAIGLLSLLSAIFAFYWAWESEGNNLLAEFIKRRLHLMGTFAGVVSVVFFLLGAFFPKRPRIVLVLAFSLILLRMWYVLHQNEYILQIDVGWVLNIFFLFGLAYAAFAYYEFRKLLHKND
ncbi:MAG: hypothetical protein OIF50_02185 [Flavobacteriaceae bacterium]|nr:hypothetical protein [Flavobacteriaceae bacterium]